jgi:hypothetical protein
LKVRVVPGLAFSIVSDLGFAVSLVTHQVPRYGDLIWVAKPVFDDEPDVQAVEAIEQWRWPLFFPTGSAIRRKLVTPIAVVDIPLGLKAFPRMRGGNRQMGWREVEYVDGAERVVGITQDASLPISQIVNDTRLKEMIVSAWVPERDW